MSTVERLRADIDSGRTADKVAASDPAAAPLGSDEEAAGTRISKAAIATALAHEVIRGPTREGIGSVLLYMSIQAVVLTILMAGVLFSGTG